MPGGVLPGIADPLPIKLQQGDSRWGAIHIQQRHGRWLVQNKHNAASMVHLKLQQSGTVFPTEETDKSKIVLALHPSALLILTYIPNEHFLSVTSVYFKNNSSDGDPLGRYKGNARPRTAGIVQPIFAPPIVPLPAAQLAAQSNGVVATLNTVASNGPAITYKKKRTF